MNFQFAVERLVAKSTMLCPFGDDGSWLVQPWPSSITIVCGLSFYLPVYSPNVLVVCLDKHYQKINTRASCRLMCLFLTCLPSWREPTQHIPVKIQWRSVRDTEKAQHSAERWPWERICTQMARQMHLGSSTPTGMAPWECWVGWVYGICGNCMYCKGITNDKCSENFLKFWYHNNTIVCELMRLCDSCHILYRVMFAWYCSSGSACSASKWGASDGRLRFHRGGSEILGQRQSELRLPGDLSDGDAIDVDYPLVN